MFVYLSYDKSFAVIRDETYTGVYLILKREDIKVAGSLKNERRN